MPFFLLKGLSFLPFGGLFKNPKVLLFIVLVIALAIAYFKWKSAIEERVYNAIYTEQAEQHIENQRRELERQRQIMIQSQKAMEASLKRREALLKEIEEARSRTRNVAPEDNGPVAPVLKDSLEFIRSREGSPEPRGPSIGDRVDSALESGSKALRDAQEAAESTGNKAIDAWRKELF